MFLREQKGVKQSDLAGWSGVSAAAISEFERGASTPRLSTFLKIAWSLGEDPARLISEIPSGFDTL